MKNVPIAVVIQRLNKMLLDGDNSLASESELTILKTGIGDLIRGLEFLEQVHPGIDSIRPDTKRSKRKKKR